ncbi:MAG: DUF5681 domain-containing protein [Paracoccaceae bacterium]
MSEDRNSGPNAEGRDERGRFAAGNPGKPRGLRHKATRAVEALLEGEAEALTRTAIDAALGGDTTALRLCLDRIAPARKDAPVTVDLPPMASAADAAEAMAAVVAQAAAGEITPGEAAAMAGLIEAYRKTLETMELERRIAVLEGEQGKA